MINLSRRRLASGELGVADSINLLIQPDLYLVEDVRDFIKNAPRIEYPWYKGLPYPDRIFARDSIRGYFILNNVGIELYNSEDMDGDGGNYFIVHDKSGSRVMTWPGRTSYFEAMRTFDEVSAEEGLMENDWVDEVFIKYLVPSNLPIIIDVTKRQGHGVIDTETECITRWLARPALA